MISSNNGGIPAPLMTVVSASGGVGRSTIALVSAWLAARAGIDTTLVEGDLQFGSMGFWLGLDDELPDLGHGASAQPISLRENLSIYKAPCLPEVAEEVSEEVARLVDRARGRAQLVIADTGQFWSGLTADLACNSDIVLVVVDPRPSSVVGAVKACELLGRIGVPMGRCIGVYNRWSARSRLGAGDVSQGTGIELVDCVPEAKDDVESIITAAGVDELVVSGNPLVRGVDALLVDVLPRMGKVYSGGGSRRRGRRAR